MKKICFITTVPGTLESFVIKTAEYLHNSGEFDVTFVCDADDRFAESLPDYIHYRPVPMKRGINLGGIKAIRQMKKLFKEEKFDIVQYSTPNASLYASIAAKSAKIPVRLYCQWGIVYVAFSGIKRKIFKCIEKKVCKLSTWIEPDSFGNLRFSRAEGLYNESKNSVIEAEAMGVPVIVTDIPGPVDAMSEGKTGLIVKKADVESLKSAMLSIYNDDKMRNDFASNTLEFVKNRFEQKQLLLHILKDRKRLLGDK